MALSAPNTLPSIKLPRDLSTVSFFSDRSAFRVVERLILPDLLKVLAPKRSLTVWCVSSSLAQTGLSMAMLLDEAFPQTRSWKVQIIETNSSQSSPGQYGRFVTSHVQSFIPPHYRHNYFVEEGNVLLMKPEILERVEHQAFDLRGSWPYMAAADLVLMLDGLDGYSPIERMDIASKLPWRLAPHGVLVLPSGEDPPEINEMFKRSGTTGKHWYRRPAFGTL